MANAITKFKKYIDLLDEVYKLASLTAKLDSDSTLARAGANANEIVIPKISMDALADYSRNSGYVSGDVTLTNETVAFNYDRGRKFNVDEMDNEETVGLAFGKLAGEFIRTKVVPELDAFRFATYAGISGISTVAGAALSTGSEVIAALRAATNTMDEDEVPYEGRELFITPTLKGLIDDLDTTKSREVLSRYSSVTLVPQSRFYTAIDLKDGTTQGETAGGYAKVTSSTQSFTGNGSTTEFTVTAKPAALDKVTVGGTVTTAYTYDAATGKITFTTAPANAAAIVASYGAARDINFMVIRKDALMQYPKHTVNKIFTPQENQSADAWIFAYRAYGLADAYENKVAGIYLHKSTT